MLRDKLLARLAEMGDPPDYVRLVTEILGIRGASAPLARRLVAQALVVEDRHEVWRRVGEAICRHAPASPGVYILRDAEGRALYVGKAVDLRRRLRGHFAEHRWRALKPAMARVAGAEWEQVGSELEALMREAALIRRLRPPVNVQIGTPALLTRALPRSLIRDAVLILPSVDSNSAELVAARADGGSMIQRTHRKATHPGLASRLWQFFRRASEPGLRADEDSLAPIVFSWLAGRGANTTAVDPHDAGSARDLRLRLDVLLKDEQLFVERLVNYSETLLTGHRRLRHSWRVPSQGPGLRE